MVHLNEQPAPDWSAFYAGATELIPVDMPEPRGNKLLMTTFVDSNHAADTVTRRSRTGIIIFLNSAPIFWSSKKQNSIETSTFGSEFTAMKAAVEVSEGLRYKLRMMGIPIDGPTRIKGDNMAVVSNTSIPESVLKKKSNSIAYHYVREHVASGSMLVSHEPSKTNVADVCTKTQAGPVRQELVRHLLF